MGWGWPRASAGLRPLGAARPSLGRCLSPPSKYKHVNKSKWLPPATVASAQPGQLVHFLCGRPVWGEAGGGGAGGGTAERQSRWGTSPSQPPHMCSHTRTHAHRRASYNTHTHAHSSASRRLQARPPGIPQGPWAGTGVQQAVLTACPRCSVTPGLGSGQGSWGHPGAITGLSPEAKPGRGNRRPLVSDAEARTLAPLDAGLPRLPTGDLGLALRAACPQVRPFGSPMTSGSPLWGSPISSHWGSLPAFPGPVGSRPQQG